jgi:AcrR family transcriptional regulator
MASDTRDIILGVARRLFAQRGYTATSTREIAEEAGVGKATVYHHFEDKRAIVLALLEQSIAATRPAVKAARAESDPRRRIQMIVEGNLRFFVESGDILQIMQREVRDGMARAQAEYRACQRELSVLLEDALKRGIKQGLFRSMDPADGVWLLTVLIEGTFAVTCMAGDGARPLGAATAALLDAFFRVLEK